MFRTLSGKFIAIVVPFLLVAFSLMVGAYEWITYQKAHERLIKHLNVVASSQSIILAEPVAARDKARVGLLLATVISDRDLIGVAVYDDTGAPLDTFGTLTAESPDLMKRITINYATGDNFRKVGELLLIMSSRRIVEETKNHLLYDTGLALALLLAGIAGAVLAHRRIVTQPLARLVDAFSETRGGGGFRSIDGASDDEIGQLIAAYNEMNARLAAYETERTAIHEELERRVSERTRDLDTARRNAEAANRAKSKFLASMSHELRTPLNAILGFSQMLGYNPKEPLTQKQSDSVKLITRSGNHLLDLINEVLELSKIEAEKVDLTIEAADPVALIHDCLATIRTSADARSIFIEDHTKSLEFPLVHVDTTRFKQVLLNLLSNAVKYNYEGGRVSVMAEVVPGNALRISVRDTGPGIPKAHHGNVFEPFERLGREASDVEGTGIGLVISRQLTELMGGAIGFASDVGQGAMFWIEVPFAEPLPSSRNLPAA